MGTFGYTSKCGSMSFARKLRRMVHRGKAAQARWLWRNREARFGKSKWNPAYGVLRCAYTGHTHALDGMATTLRQFIAENELNPEDGGRGLEWFLPDDMRLIESRENADGTQLHIFSDGCDRCGLVDTDTMSILLSGDELAAEESAAD